MTGEGNFATERRANPRFDLNAPITVSVGAREFPGFTRNLSNRGVYFFLDAHDCAPVRGEIEFTVELPPELTLTANCVIRCQGRVIRADQTASQMTGIAAEILHYSMDRRDD